MLEITCPPKIYLQTVSDLEAKGLTSHLHTIDFGSLGHWLVTSQRTLLKAALPLTAKKAMDEAACKVYYHFILTFLT